jgi:hypothetical protein
MTQSHIHHGERTRCPRSEPAELDRASLKRDEEVNPQPNRVGFEHCQSMSHVPADPLSESPPQSVRVFHPGRLADRPRSADSGSRRGTTPALVGASPSQTQIRGRDPAPVCLTPPRTLLRLGCRGTGAANGQNRHAAAESGQNRLVQPQAILKAARTGSCSRRRVAERPHQEPPPPSPQSAQTCQRPKLPLRNAVETGS